jgi:hypothetical protein
MRIVLLALALAFSASLAAADTTTFGVAGAEVALRF